MTLQQIAARINKNETYLAWNFDRQTANAWEKYGKQRIYFADTYFELVNGSFVQAGYATQKSRYETTMQHMDRSDAMARQDKNMYAAILRYINILIKK